MALPPARAVFCATGGGNVHMTAFSNELLRIKTLVAAHRDSLVTRNLLQHQQGGIALSASVRFEQLRIHDQSVAILHQKIAAITQLGLLARASFASGSVFDSCV